MIRVLLVDDHPILIESLTVLLNSINGVEVVGTLHNGKEALTFLELNETDIVLTDLSMPILNGIGLTLQIRRLFPKVKVLMLTMMEDAEQIKEAIQAGVHGYVLKKANRKELEKAIRAVYDGHQHFSENVVMQLAAVAKQSPYYVPDPLEEPVVISRRELEIMLLIIEEIPNAEIAKQLELSTFTVETHRRNLMKKIGVNSPLGLLKYALKHKLVEG
jgi:DNA-binding NarL/FixJ family response regulator